MKFKLIAERHPASDGWFLSSYRNVNSHADSPDFRSEISDFRNTMKKLEYVVVQGKKNAIIDGLAKLREKYDNHRLRGRILQIGSTMISFNISKNIGQAKAETYCSNMTHGGFKNWRLPGQYELASLFRNDRFTEWGSRVPVVDTPDAFFWGTLYRQLESRQRMSFFLTRDSTDGQHIQNYIIRLYHNIRGEENISGEAISKERADNYRGGSIDLITMCINVDVVDNARFYQSTRPASE